MNKKYFKKLSMEDKLGIALTLDPLGARQTNNWNVITYKINSFYIDLLYDRKTSDLKEIKSYGKAEFKRLCDGTVYWTNQIN